MSEGRRVVLAEVHHGSPAQERGHVIYAVLRDAETGEAMISATLPYILNAVRERGLVFVKEAA